VAGRRKAELEVMSNNKVKVLIAVIGFLGGIFGTLGATPWLHEIFLNPTDSELAILARARNEGCSPEGIHAYTAAAGRFSSVQGYFQRGNCAEQLSEMPQAEQDYAKAWDLLSAASKTNNTEPDWNICKKLRNLKLELKESPLYCKD
jgi:hypothetical protein